MKTRGIELCKLCHSKIHTIEKEKSLGEHYNTLDLIIAHPEMIKFIPFARKQKS